MKVAVIGAGISGITAAYLLGRKHDVMLIERERSIGGHTRTIVVDDASGALAVDLGFIVCNPRTYPNFYRLLDEWGVARRDSDMSCGYSCEESGIGYVGPALGDFLRKPSNLFRPKLLSMIRERRRFNRRAARDLRLNAMDDITLGAYLERLRASSFFITHYLLPIAASVWSSPDRNMLDFPAMTFLRFFENHGMLDLRQRPTWQTIVGGSHAYIRAFLQRFTGRVLVDAPVQAVMRDPGGVTVRIAGREDERFDRIVLATHADVTRAILTDASKVEHAALSAWSYHHNVVQLHTDTSMMPTDRRLWASWNYHRRADSNPDTPVTMTYSMNRLQGLRSSREYLVSLNAAHRVNPDHLLHTVQFSHPAYTPRSIAAQDELRRLNGENRTYYCGAHLRYGFHEDGVASAVDVAHHFGVAL